MLVDNPFNYPFGHPVFHPIYEAADETGRPVAIHGGAGGWANPASTGGGNVNLYFEAHTLWPQAVMTHLVSFVSHGVFDKFPGLKLLLIEAGSAWLPSLLWRFDAEYKGLRREVPWLKRLPSEYVAEHVWLTTQPLEMSPRREQIDRAAALVRRRRIGWSTRPTIRTGTPTKSPIVSARLPAGVASARSSSRTRWTSTAWTEADLPAPRVEVAAMSAMSARARRFLRTRRSASSKSGDREIGIVALERRLLRGAQPLHASERPALCRRTQRRLTADFRAPWSSTTATPVLACPWHGWEFDVRTGRGIRDRTYRARTYRVEIADGRVLVDLGAEGTFEGEELP